MSELEGCGHKFVYQDLEEGVLVLICGVWTEVKKNSSHQKLKWCYDCLDKFYEEYLKTQSNPKEDLK